MKLVTAVIAADRAYGVIAALDVAGLRATTMASTEAPWLKGRSLSHRGAQYRDKRCVRVEILVSEHDAEIAFGILAPAGEIASDEIIVWFSEVNDLAAPPVQQFVSDNSEMSGV